MTLVYLFLLSAPFWAIMAPAPQKYYPRLLRATLASLVISLAVFVALPLLINSDQLDTNYLKLIPLITTYWSIWILIWIDRYQPEDDQDDQDDQEPIGPIDWDRFDQLRSRLPQPDRISK